jgi:hypothetical protein
VLLPPSITRTLTSDWADDDAIDGGEWDGYVAAYRFIAAPPADELERARELAAAMLIPAPRERITAALGKMRYLTVARDQGHIDLGPMILAYADELRAYPLDVVEEVIAAWTGHHRFWPSFTELRMPAERLMAPRRALARALEEGYRPPPPAEQEPPPPTEEDKARVAAMVASLGPPSRRRERRIEAEPMTAEDRRRVFEESRNFRLPDADDPKDLEGSVSNG